MNDPKRMDVIGLLGPLRCYARSLTRDETQADDLVQDTLVRAYERHGSFRSGGCVCANASENKNIKATRKFPQRRKDAKVFLAVLR